MSLAPRTDTASPPGGGTPSRVGAKAKRLSETDPGQHRRHARHKPHRKKAHAKDPLAGIVYVDDRMPGIVRQRKGNGFAYRAPDGHWLQEKDPADRAHIRRIRALAIPPAYRDVWICPLPNGHLQATGRDARGRKQYRYHAMWREARDLDKFGRMRAFGEALPRLRQRVHQDLMVEGSGKPLARENVLAALVRLLDATHVRVGNEAYARENKSYGLTTLRNRHAKVEGSVVKLRFRGKSGIWHDVAMNDPRVARIVRRCQNMPGQELFQYEDQDGDKALHSIGSNEVNAYIREATGGDFTAKDFRTWHATVHAWSLLCPKPGEVIEDESEAARTRRIVAALKEVAAKLGNTVAVCRKSYVHPLVLTCAAKHEWPEANPALDAALSAPKNGEQGLDESECGLLCFLEAAAPPASSLPATH